MNVFLDKEMFSCFVISLVIDVFVSIEQNGVFINGDIFLEDSILICMQYYEEVQILVLDLLDFQDSMGKLKCYQSWELFRIFFESVVDIVFIVRSVDGDQGLGMEGFYEVFKDSFF